VSYLGHYLTPGCRSGWHSYLGVVRRRPTHTQLPTYSPSPALSPFSRAAAAQPFPRCGRRAGLCAPLANSDGRRLVLKPAHRWTHRQGNGCARPRRNGFLLSAALEFRGLFVGRALARARVGASVLISRRDGNRDWSHTFTIGIDRSTSTGSNLEYELTSRDSGYYSGEGTLGEISTLNFENDQNGKNKCER